MSKIKTDLEHLMDIKNWEVRSVIHPSQKYYACYNHFYFKGELKSIYFCNKMFFYLPRFRSTSTNNLKKAHLFLNKFGFVVRSEDKSGIIDSFSSDPFYSTDSLLISLDEKLKKANEIYKENLEKKERIFKKNDFPQFMDLKYE